MLHRPRRLVFTVAALCLLAACTPTSPTPTPSPAPSYRCTPEAGGDEFDCSEAQHDGMVAKDELYAEAEAVYRRFYEENLRILRLGGVAEPTPVLLATTSGSYLRDAMDTYAYFRKHQLQIQGEDRAVVLTRLPGKSRQGSVAAMSICVDGRSVQFLKDGKPDGYGSAAVDETYFARVDGALKIIGADGKDVTTCA